MTLLLYFTLPLTTLIFMCGLLLYQKNHYRFLEKEENFVSPEKILDSLTDLKKEVIVLRQKNVEQNQRLDTVILKMGFKL